MPNDSVALTLDELIDLDLERHAVHVRPRTIRTLEDRLRHARAAFGNEPLADLERMVDELAGRQATLPSRAGHGIAQALRQVPRGRCSVGRSPANLAKPPGATGSRRGGRWRLLARGDRGDLGRAITHAGAAAAFAAATGLRPEEWQALERRDIDLRSGVVHVGVASPPGRSSSSGKTARSRRQVPLSPAALQALEDLPPARHAALFSAERGGLLNLDNFRRREWSPAIEAGAISRPARIYDLRSRRLQRPRGRGRYVHARPLHGDEQRDDRG